MPLPYPEMKASGNKWLLLKDGVELRPVIEKVICLLDPWFEKYKIISYVTSGYRSAESQLRLIQNVARGRGIDKTRPEILAADLYGTTQYEGRTVPVWAPAWNELLVSGFLVNPPIRTELLKSYFHPAMKKTIGVGTVINLSTHQLGLAFDVGGSGGKDKTLKDELIVIEDAFTNIPEMRSITPENINNCVHVTCREDL